MISRHNLFNTLILFLLLTYTTVLADVKGVIVDNESNEPIIGANISVLGTLIGDITDRKGNFHIKSSKDSLLIEIQYAGYEKKSIFVSSLNPVKIELKRLTYHSNELIVSANKKTESIQNVPISVSLIKSEDFSTRNITSIDYALQYVPGVEVNQDNVSIRGSSGFSFGIGTRTIFLQDGFPLLSADNNDIKFDIIPILLIDRVEIIKGAGSALYGTSALGGVINVLTAKPSFNPMLRARLYSGLYDSPKYEQWNWSDKSLIDKGLDLAYSQKFGDYGIMGSASMFSRDSYKRYDKLERLSMFLKQLYDFSEKTNVELAINYSTSKTDDWVYWNSLDSALIPPTGTDESIAITSNKLAVSSSLKHILNESSFMNIRLGLFNTYFSNMLAIDNIEYRESTGNTYFFETQYSNSLNDENSLITGIESRINQVSSFTYGDNIQTILGAYAQLENKSISNLIATIGIRTDKELLDTIDTKFQYSPKIGLNYTLSEDITLRSSYGRGFRTASLAERFASVQFQGFNVIANPELKSEISQSLELGLSYDIINSTDYLKLDISSFYNRYDDLIEPTFENNSQAVIKFMNIIEAEISGIEIDMTFKTEENFTLKSSLTYLNPKNIVENKDLKYRSNYLWYSSINYKLLPFEVQLDYRYKSKYNEIDDRLGLTIEGRDLIENHEIKIDAHILDISFSVYSDIFDTKTKFTMNMKNALNYYYLEMVGNLAPIRFLNFQIESEL
ncbi:MAG: TonB-dependent receptor [Candidatus Kapaibacterium sp.]